MKQTLTFLFLLAAFLPELFAQENSPLDRPNELYGGYGLISVYNFSGGSRYHDQYSYNEEEITSPGTFLLGYNRQLGRIISIGINLSYVNATNKITNGDPYYDTLYTVGTTEHNYFSGMTQLTFTYVNKRLIKLYSAVALGITADFSNDNSYGSVSEDRNLQPAGQLTMFGIRVGKALGGYMEFGIGTNAILVFGVSYRFKDAE
jgi:hypothetical protein